MVLTFVAQIKKKEVLVVIVGKGYTFIVYRNLVKFKTYMRYNSTVS